MILLLSATTIKQMVPEINNTIDNKLKLSIAHKGHKVSEETRKKMSDSQKRRRDNE